MRVARRVHGPYQHRQRWRVEVWEYGKRTARPSYATYAEALQAARSIQIGGGTTQCDSSPAPSGTA